MSGQPVMSRVEAREVLARHEKVESRAFRFVLLPALVANVVSLPAAFLWFPKWPHFIRPMGTVLGTLTLAAILVYWLINWRYGLRAPDARQARERLKQPPLSPLQPCEGELPRAEPIIGFRFWMLGACGELHAMAQPVQWGPGENKAVVRAGDCPGLYALKMSGMGRIVTVAQSFAPSAVGIVQFYGRVVEHEYGYRAEKARILALSWAQLESDPGAEGQQRVQEMAQRAAELYGVPYFDTVTGLLAFAREMGAET